MRALVLLLAAAGLAAAEGWTCAGGARAYRYELSQEVAWTSAGDRLAYVSTLAWTVLLDGRGLRDGRLDLAAAVVRVTASHRGPGAEHRFDSAERGDDPLFGHLKALEGTVLILSVDPATGQVAQVRGAEGIATALARRSPNLADPAAPSPLAEAARAAYSPERLARLWSQVLARPQAGVERVPLGEPLSGTAERRWEGETWTLALPAGQEPLPVTLLADPTPVTGTVEGLRGQGRSQAVGGWPGDSQGELRFTLVLAAQGQAVRQEHHLGWRFTPQP